MAIRDITLYNRPLLNFSCSTDERFVFVSICAALAIAQSAWSDKGATLILAAVVIVSALATGLVINAIRKKPGLSDSSSLATALILTLLLPNTTPPLCAALSAVFAIAVVKESFGGLGANWLNPALGGWLLVRFAWPLIFDTSLEGSSLGFIEQLMREAAGSGIETNPVSMLSRNSFGVESGDAITPFLNVAVFSLFNIELPANYLGFFFNPGAGVIADRGVLGLLLGTVLLISTSASRFALSLIYVCIVSFFVRIAGALPLGGAIGEGDILFCLFSGGTLVAAFLLVIEPVTSPKSALGRVLLVVFAALLTFYFRYIKAESYGAMFAVACINVLTPLVRMMEERLFYERGTTKNSHIPIDDTAGGLMDESAGI
jgi:electron transport complex protein RnfD